jgi:DNA-binding transcriptional regulator YhcF (GntR family)
LLNTLGLSAIARVKETFRQRILSGEVGSGDKLPGIRVTAEELSVHPTTVAEAYRQLAAEGLVESRHGVGTYVAGRAAEGELLLLMGGPNTPNSHGSAVAEALSNRIRLAGHEIVTLRVGHDLSATIDALRSRIDRGVLRGVWLHSFLAKYAVKVQDFLDPYGIPLIHCSATRAARHSAHYDMPFMVRTGAQWLAEAGCKHVAFLCPDTGLPSQMCAEVCIGVCEALKVGWELVNDPLELPVKETSVYERFGSDAVDRLVANKVPFDGLLIRDDWVARGALAALLRHGRRVPEDVQVCSYAREGDRFWEVFGMSIARVESSESVFVEAVCELMERLLAGDDVPSPRILIRGRFIPPGEDVAGEVACSACAPVVV